MIVSIPDLRTLTYFNTMLYKDETQIKNLTVYTVCTSWLATTALSE